MRRNSRPRNRRPLSQRGEARTCAGCAIKNVLEEIELDFHDLYPDPPQEHAPRVMNPWRVSEVVRALRYELYVAAVAVGDIEHGRPISEEDRIRAERCRERMLQFEEKLRDAAS